MCPPGRPVVDLPYGSGMGLRWICGFTAMARRGGRVAGSVAQGGAGADAGGDSGADSGGQPDQPAGGGGFVALVEPGDGGVHHAHRGCVRVASLRASCGPTWLELVSGELMASRPLRGLLGAAARGDDQAHSPGRHRVRRVTGRRRQCRAAANGRAADPARRRRHRLGAAGALPGPRPQVARGLAEVLLSPMAS
jgi:hypothetical protein